MGSKGGSAPAPPDPYATAGAQTQYSKDTAAYNTALNRINTTTPLGSQTFTTNGKDPATGAPIYQQNISLSPEQQQLYSQQLQQNLGIGNVNNQMLGQVQSAYGSGIQSPGQAQRSIDTSGVSNIPGAGDLGGFTKQAQDAAYKQNTQYLDPQYDRQEQQLRTQLMNSGATEGSEAYKNSMQQFNDQKQKAYSDARNQSVQQGLQEQQSLYGMGANTNAQQFGQAQQQGQFGNQALNQQLQQMFALRDQPMNEFNALRSASQVSMPQFQGAYQGGSAQNPDFMGAANNAYQGALGGYNANVASANSTMSTLYGLGGALGAAMISDERAKHDIKPIGKMPSGLTVYEFKYLGSNSPHVGVMAQEARKYFPDAVEENADGILRVDYRKVH
jgi:hypothetical protein